MSQLLKILQFYTNFFTMELQSADQNIMIISLKHVRE